MADVSKGSRAAIVRWGLKVFERHLVSLRALNLQNLATLFEGVIEDEQHHEHYTRGLLGEL